MKVTCPGCKTAFVIPDMNTQDSCTVVCDMCEAQFDVKKKTVLLIPFTSTKIRT